VRLILAEKAPVLRFDANDPIHCRELTHLIRISLSEKTAIPFHINSAKMENMGRDVRVAQGKRSGRPVSLAIHFTTKTVPHFTFAIAPRSSRHASAPPTENQGDYEQQQEHDEQHFRDAGGRSGDTAKSKDRCHKRNNQENYSPT
jgi:hypothetical protein